MPSPDHPSIAAGAATAGAGAAAAAGPPTGRGLLATLAGWFEPGEPHAVRGPFARWPRASDAVLIVVVFAASVVATGLSSLADGQDVTLSAIVDRPLGALALLAAGAAALWWRRSSPIPVAVALLVGMVVWAVLGHGDGQDLALVVALYSVGRYRSSTAQGIAIVLAAAAVSLLGTVIDEHQRIDLVPAVVLTALPWYIGRRVRNRGDYVALLQDRARRLEAEQQARARQAVVDERARIARELHDVVAHQVSMMTVQAGAARTIAPHDLDAAIEAMGDTERAGRAALGELRHLLGVLRPDGSDPDDLGPRPGLAEIPAVVDELRRTGAQVTLTGADVGEGVSAAVGLAAYRIVQESLTNIIKHAGPTPTVTVEVTVEEDQLVIDIVNSIDAPDTGMADTNGTANADGTASTAVTPLPASGFGLLGMRERAASLGGTLQAAAEPPGRYRVTARLPIEAGTP